MQIQNTQLAAGTYVFKLADTADRHIVQIFNEDKTQVLATIIAIPDYRVTPTDNTVVKFAETGESSQAAGTVPENGIPIKEWFYPGDNFGNEFKVVPTQTVAAVTPEAPPAPPAQPEAAPPDYIFEQPPAEILAALLPRYVEMEFYRALLESTAAEYAARMTAMEAATSNAAEMIDKLTLYMNRVRQASITKEIIEVVSGAAAAE